MKNMRIPLIIALFVAVLGIVFGSIFDLQISTAIASANNGFGLTVSIIGPTIGFGAVALMGGGFIALIKKGDYHIALKILFGVLAACCFGVAVFYPAGEWFGVNGFYNPELDKWLGYVLAFFPAAGALVGGYFLFRDYQNKNIWIVFCIIIGLLLIALLGIIPTLKDTIHRPRYRLLATTDAVGFHNWWEPCKEYKELIASIPTGKDNFKSYPSGHTAEASILFVGVTFLPLINNKFKKYQMPLFYGSCAFVALIAFARILAAAHFLSDVSTGATVILTLTLIANEVVMRIKALQIEEQPAEEK